MSLPVASRTIISFLHITTHNEHDAHGRLTRLTDPNGVVTTYSYTPWGGLSKITYPDGTWVEYGYDPAHRLTSLADAAGRRIVYTLDPAGNRIGEAHVNPDGSPAREIRRHFDALGRLKDEIEGAAGALPHRRAPTVTMPTANNRRGLAPSAVPRSRLGWLIPAGKRQVMLAAAGEAMFREDFAGHWLSFDEAAAMHYASVSHSALSRAAPPVLKIPRSPPLRSRPIRPWRRAICPTSKGSTACGSPSRGRRALEHPIKQVRIPSLTSGV
jgi:YD repeat-containing protein